VDRVRLPGGRIVDHHVIHFPRPSVCVVVENDREEILMVRAHRYVLGRSQWELPAGSFEKKESPLSAARREVEEESGYETSGHKRLYTFHPINGISDKIFHIVSCRAGKKTKDFDRNEVAAVRWVPKKELAGLIQKQKVKDGYSLTALLLYFSLSPAPPKKSA
jgi:ADP-ribose pyrophosphatase